MSFDWTPGTKNEHGVYCPTETLRMERDKKGWRGSARVEIDLVQTADGWRSHRGFAFFSGNWWGSGGPLTDHCKVHATREDAIRQQIEGLRAEFAKLDIPSMQAEAREMLAWADNLIPDQLELFAA